MAFSFTTTFLVSMLVFLLSGSWASWTTRKLNVAVTGTPIACVVTVAAAVPP